MEGAAADGLVEVDPVPALRDESNPLEIWSQVLAKRISLGRKDLVLLIEGEPKGEKNLPLGIHPTVHTLLDGMNRAEGHSGLPG